MKKLLLLGAMVTALCTAKAADPAIVSFLNGTAVVLSNNVAVTYGDALVNYTNYQGTFVQALTNTYFTNGIVWTGKATNSNVIFDGAFRDVNTWPLKNGDVNNNLAFHVSAVGSSVSDTQVLTIVFGRMISDSVAPTAAADKFTTGVTLTGTTPVSLVTNIATGYMQGTTKWRLISVTPSNVTDGRYGLLNNCALVGWTP